MQVQLTQWSPKNSNLFRFYVKSENQNFGYIQMNFDKIKANQENTSYNIKLVGDETILQKIVDLKGFFDLHAFLMQNSVNAYVLGSKLEKEAQKSKFLKIN